MIPDSGPCCTSAGCGLPPGTRAELWIWRIKGMRVGVVTGAGLRRLGGRTGVGPVMMRGAWGVARGKAAVAVKCTGMQILQVCPHPHTHTHVQQSNRQGRKERTISLFNKGNRGIVCIYSGLLYQDPSRHPPPILHISYDVMLTRLNIGVSVGPIQNGQLHQLHFLQVVLPLSLKPTQQHRTVIQTIHKSKNSLLLDSSSLKLCLIECKDIGILTLETESMYFSFIRPKRGL